MSAIATTQLSQLQVEQAINNNDTGTMPMLKTTQVSDLNTAGSHTMALQGNNGWGYPNTNLPNIEV